MVQFSKALPMGREQQEFISPEF